MAGTKTVWWVKFLSHLVQGAVLMLMVLLWPGAPLACAVLSGRTRFLRRYASSLQKSAHSIRALWRADVIARNLERVLVQRVHWPLDRMFREMFAWSTSSFLFQPAASVNRSQTARAAHEVQGDCSHCGQCCLDKSCVFLEWTDEGLSRCSIHNNWFWKLTSCGSYPIDAQSIVTYNCPSFKAIPIRVEHASVCDAAGQR